MLDGLLDDPGKFEVVILESIEHAYARVRHERTDLVIICLAIDDDAVCLFLTRSIVRRLEIISARLCARSHVLIDTVS